MKPSAARGRAGATGAKRRAMSPSGSKAPTKKGREKALPKKSTARSSSSSQNVLSARGGKGRAKKRPRMQNGHRSDADRALAGSDPTNGRADDDGSGEESDHDRMIPVSRKEKELKKKRSMRNEPGSDSDGDSERAGPSSRMPRKKKDASASQGESSEESERDSDITVILSDTERGYKEEPRIKDKGYILPNFLFQDNPNGLSVQNNHSSIFIGGSVTDLLFKRGPTQIVIDSLLFEIVRHHAEVFASRANKLICKTRDKGRTPVDFEKDEKPEELVDMTLPRQYEAPSKRQLFSDRRVESSIPIYNDVPHSTHNPKFVKREANEFRTPRTDQKIQYRCNCKGDCGKGCNCRSYCVKAELLPDGRILPKEYDLFSMHLYVCGPECGCDASLCKNRVEWKEQESKLEVFLRKEDMGFEMRSLRWYRQGEVVTEFIGEIACDLKRNTEEEYSYVLFDPHNVEHADAGHLSEAVFKMKERLAQLPKISVNPFSDGSMARFIGHSSFPNLCPIRVYSNGMWVGAPRLFMVALFTVVPGDTLKIDYGDSYFACFVECSCDPTTKCDCWKSNRGCLCEERLCHDMHTLAKIECKKDRSKKGWIDSKKPMVTFVNELFVARELSNRRRLRQKEEEIMNGLGADLREAAESAKHPELADVADRKMSKEYARIVRHYQDLTADTTGREMTKSTGKWAEVPSAQEKEKEKEKGMQEKEKKSSRRAKKTKSKGKTKKRKEIEQEQMEEGEEKEEEVRRRKTKKRKKTKEVEPEEMEDDEEEEVRRRKAENGKKKVEEPKKVTVAAAVDSDSDVVCLD